MGQICSYSLHSCILRHLLRHLCTLPILLYCILTGCSAGVVGRDLHGIREIFREQGIDVVDSIHLSRFTREDLRLLGAESSLGLAQLLLEAHRTEEARLVLIGLVKHSSHPWREEALRELALLLRAEGRWDRLEELLDGEEGLNGDLLDSFLEAVSEQGKLELLERQLARYGLVRPVLAAIAAMVAGSVELPRYLHDAVYLSPAGENHLRLAELLVEKGIQHPEVGLIVAKGALHLREIGESTKTLFDALDTPASLTPILIEELVLLFRLHGDTLRGARRLEELAQRAGSGGKSLKRDPRWVAFFGAGRLYRWAGEYTKSAECFSSALQTSPDEERRRLRWYLLDTTLSISSVLGTDALLSNPGWIEHGYFDDLADRMSAILAGEGRWMELARLSELFLSKGGRMEARGAYLLARMGQLGLASSLSEKEIEQLYRRATAADPTGLYGWYGRYHTGRWDSIPEGLRYDEPIGDLSGEGDPPLRLYLSLGMLAKAMERWHNIGDKATMRDRIRIAALLQEGGDYLGSIRFLRAVPPEAPEMLWRLLYPITRYAPEIEATARQNELPPSLLFALVRRESGFSSGIESHAGAIGLTQLMPATAKDVAERINHSIISLKSPEENLKLGGWYLRWLIERLEAPWSAILAYNGGIGRVGRWKRGWGSLPPDLAMEAVPIRETREFGRSILLYSIYYGYLYHNVHPEETMDYYFQGSLSSFPGPVDRHQEER